MQIIHYIINYLEYSSMKLSFIYSTIKKSTGIIHYIIRKFQKDYPLYNPQVLKGLPFM